MMIKVLYNGYAKIKDHNQNPLNYSQTQVVESMIPHHRCQVPLEAVLEQVKN